jgi:hypothetical protein
VVTLCTCPPAAETEKTTEPVYFFPGTTNDLGDGIGPYLVDDHGWLFVVQVCVAVVSLKLMSSRYEPAADAAAPAVDAGVRCPETEYVNFAAKPSNTPPWDIRPANDPSFLIDAAGIANVRSYEGAPDTAGTHEIETGL